MGVPPAVRGLVRVCAVVAALTPRSALGVEVAEVLRASGYADAAEHAEAARTLEAQLAAAVAAVPAGADDQRGRALLQTLHGGLLRTYEADATTLRDVLDRGAYNCVAASVVYALAAARLGLEVDAELLPTHARVRVRVGGRTVRVETTSPHGFDPSARDGARIQAQVAGRERAGDMSLVDAAGLVVPTQALLGIIWVNRGVFAAHAGRFDEAERAFAEAEAALPEPRVRALLREQRANVLVRLSTAALAADAEARASPTTRALVRRTLDALGAAAALEALPSNLLAAVGINTRAIVERAASDAADDAWLVELARTPALDRIEPAQAGLARSFVAAERVARAARAGSLDEAWALAEAALAAATGRAEQARVERARARVALRALQQAADRADVEEHRRWLTRVDAARLPGGAHAASGLGARLLALGAIEPAIRALEEACDRAAIPACARDGAAARPAIEGDALEPRQAADVVHNLVAALERRAIPRVEVGACADVAPTLARIERLSPGHTFVVDAGARCALEQARRAQAAGALDEMTQAMLDAYRLRPRTVGLAANAARAAREAVARAGARGDCEAARAWLARAEVLVSVDRPKLPARCR
jgi:tetratricopeptide (TPR) repeat protein